MQQINNYLEQSIPNLINPHSMFGENSGTRLKTGTYFDTPTQDLFHSKIELLHTIEHQLPTYQQEREYISYGSYQNSNQAFTHRYPVKHYKKFHTKFDKHPLIGLVKRSQRPLLFDLLGNNIELLEQLTANIEVEHNEKVFLISHLNETVAQVSLDNYHIENFGLPVAGTLLTFEIDPIIEERLNNNEKTILKSVMCTLETDIENALSIKRLPTNLNYLDYIKLANNRLPIRSFIRQYPLFFNILQAATLSLIGFLLLVLLSGRYNNNQKLKLLKRNNRNPHA